MLFILYLPPSIHAIVTTLCHLPPMGTIRIQQHLARPYFLSTGQLPQGSECFTERRPLDAVCFWSLWQENIGTTLSFLLLCFLSCLSTCLGKKEHFFCCRLTWCLHMRINPPGGRTKAWLPNVLPHLETLCGHMAMA